MPSVVHQHQEEELLSGKPAFSEEEIEAVSNVLRSGWVGSGKEVLLFEDEMATYTGAGNVVCVDSCTSALFLSLKVLDIKKDDEVIVPSLTWCSTANAALYCGATPVFCDVDEKTLCLSNQTVLEKITKKTKAVIVVHYGGYAVNVKALREVLPNHIAIVEDAAHAFGAQYPDGSKVGSSGNLTCFSFYANKNLSTAEGGAVCTGNNKLAEELRSLRQHGMISNAWAKKNNFNQIEPRQPYRLGYKMNYIDLHACIGRVQLKKFAAMQNTRAQIIEHYFSQFKNSIAEIQFQEHLNSTHHAKHLAVVILPKENSAQKRDALLLALRNEKIGASVHYMPLHLIDFYKNPDGSNYLPVTENLYNRIITLPLGAGMNLDDADRIINVFYKAYKQIYHSKKLEA